MTDRSLRGLPGVVAVLLVVSVLVGSWFVRPASARADGFPEIGGFHSVLAFGEGESTSALDLAQFEANGTAPASATR